MLDVERILVIYSVVYFLRLCFMIMLGLSLKDWRRLLRVILRYVRLICIIMGSMVFMLFLVEVMMCRKEGKLWFCVRWLK